MPQPLGGSEQAKALKSFRRHLEKQRKCSIKNYSNVCRVWLATGMNKKWRDSFNKTHHD